MNTIPKVDNVIDIATAPEDDSSADLLQFVHHDNSAVAELFFQFSQAEEDDEKQELFDQIKTGLTVHAKLVEEILYPLLTENAEEDEQEEAEELVAEAEACNRVTALVLGELSSTDAGDDSFKALMSILCELVKKQVKREEKEIFEKLQAADLDFEELGLEAVEMRNDIEEAALSAAKKKSKSKAGAGASRAKAKPPSKNSSTKNNGASKPGAKSSSAKKPGAKPTSKSSGTNAKKSGATAGKAKKTASKPTATSSKNSSNSKSTEKPSPSKSTNKKVTAKPATSKSKASSKTAAKKKSR